MRSDLQGTEFSSKIRALHDTGPQGQNETKNERQHDERSCKGSEN